MGIVIALCSSLRSLQLLRAWFHSLRSLLSHGHGGVSQSVPPPLPPPYFPPSLPISLVAPLTPVTWHLLRLSTDTRVYLQAVHCSQEIRSPAPPPSPSIPPSLPPSLHPYLPTYLVAPLAPVTATDTEAGNSKCTVPRLQATDTSQGILTGYAL